MPPFGEAAAIVAVVSVCVYLVFYGAAPLPSVPTPPDAGSYSRTGFVLSQLLLLDDVVLSWFGDSLHFFAGRWQVALAAAAILFVSAAAGWLALAAMRLDRHFGSTETAAFSLAVGLNLLSTYVLAVGLGGWLRSPSVFVLPVLVVVVASVRLIKRKADERDPSTIADAAVAGSSWPLRAFAWLALVFIAVIVLGGMLPPVEFDVREYHLQAPKEFYQAGRITFLPHNVYANMPLGAEMHALAGMIVLGDWWLGAIAGKTVIALFVPLGAVLLFAAGCRFFSPAAGAVAALLYVSTPWMVRVSNLGLIEGAVACYLFAALYATLLWRQSKDTRLLLLAGYLAGAAVACKYPALLFVVVPLAGWVFLRSSSFQRRAGDVSPPSSKPQRKQNTWQIAAGRTMLFLLMSLAGCGLWLAKNAALTGNPVYPLFAGVIPSETRTPELVAQWQAAHGPADYSFQSAWRASLSVGGGSEWHGPLLVPLAVLACGAAFPRRKSAARAHEIESKPAGGADRSRIAVYLGIYFGIVIVAWWLTTHRLDRFWIPAMPVLALLAGVGATWQQHRFWRRSMTALILVSTAGCFLLVTAPRQMHSYGPGGYTRFFASYQATVAERITPWREVVNDAVPPGGAVLLVGEAEVFDLTPKLYYNTVFDASIFERWRKNRSAAEFHQLLARNKVTHVFVRWDEIARYRRTYGFTDFVQPSVFQELVEQQVLQPVARPADASPAQRLYRVRKRPSAVQRKLWIAPLAIRLAVCDALASGESSFAWRLRSV